MVLSCKVLNLYIAALQVDENTTNSFSIFDASSVDDARQKLKANINEAVTQKSDPAERVTSIGKPGESQEVWFCCAHLRCMRLLWVLYIHGCSFAVVALLWLTLRASACCRRTLRESGNFSLCTFL